MRILHNQNSNLHLSSLICSLLVFVPTDELFKKLDLKKDIYWGLKNKSFALKNVEYFYPLLNKISIRRFSYNLIKPVISKQLPDSDIKKTKNNFNNETILLQKYLKKFKVFYKQYFLINEDNTNRLLTDKDINSLALESLFILSGI